MIDLEGFALNTYAYTFSHSAGECIDAYAGGGAQGLGVSGNKVG